MIDQIHKEINNFLSEIENINSDTLNLINQKYSISICDDLQKGHLTSNVCMIAASICKTSPDELANKLEKRLKNLKVFKDVHKAGPGFINITLKRIDFISIIKKISTEKEKFGHSNLGKDKKIQIEFVSANPTGPLHVGHGRGAAYGDAIARVLRATGHIVEKEYYVNDAGRQIDILTASIILKKIAKLINNFFPKNGYQGKYISEISNKFNDVQEIDPANYQNIAKDISSDPEQEIDEIIIKLKNINIDYWNAIKEFSLQEIINSISNDLNDFNVSFDNWFYESSLGRIDNKSSEIGLSINKLVKNGAYEKDGAIWLNTESSGDDKHRVLVREDGRATYFASDVAYHKNKIDRGFNTLINIWGADHHGYIKRIEASIDALGSDSKKLIVKLVQFANLYKEGEKVKMSTRSGDFFTLKKLIDDIGPDAARFYYLSKQADQHLDFDIDLAKSDSKENIFYYIQYAHARIYSLQEKFNQAHFEDINNHTDNVENGSYIKCDKLIHEISKYPHIVKKAALTLQPHIIIFYLKDLSQLLHSFYNDNHVLSETPENMLSIIKCLSAVKQVISNGLGILGISALKKM